MKANDRYLVEGVQCRLDGPPMPVANLSVGGFFVVSEQAPMPGQVVELELTLIGRPPFRMLGMVTWINDPAHPKAKDLPQGFGIKVTRISFADKLSIIDLLKRASPRDVRRADRG